MSEHKETGEEGRSDRKEARGPAEVGDRLERLENSVSRLEQRVEALESRIEVLRRGGTTGAPPVV